MKGKLLHEAGVGVEQKKKCSWFKVGKGVKLNGKRNKEALTAVEWDS